jgi:uncharacterized protein YijF (DUF1287 family)
MSLGKTTSPFSFSAISVIVVFFCTPWSSPAEAQIPPRQIFLHAARSQVGQTVRYDPAYMALAYPNGDVPLERGVCTDVVIRAFRSVDVDLQKLVHEDMKKNFKAYPSRWGLSRPDANIDHRRVPNLAVFFKRQGKSLPVTSAPANYQPGDIVTSLLPGNLPHIMVVSDRKGPDDVSWVIHNIGQGAREENGLFAYPITGHYRWF